MMDLSLPVCLAVICAAVMLQGGQDKAVDISDGGSAAEESAWHSITARVKESVRHLAGWITAVTRCGVERRTERIKICSDFACSLMILQWSI